MFKTESIKVNYDTIQDVIASYLYSIGYVDDDIDILDVDLGLEVDEAGLVDLDVTINKRAKEAR